MWFTSSLAVVAMASTAVVGAELWRLYSSIQTVELVGDTEPPPPTLAEYEGGFNILIVGDDVCEEPGGCKDRTTQLNDVTILLHVAQDQSHAVAVSFPRDLVVPISACPHPNGGTYSAMAAQPINVTLSYGGPTCTVLTVERLTGIDIQFAGLITMNGVESLSSAVGGVPVCIDAPIIDAHSGLYLPEAGTHHLVGHDVIAFLRTRLTVGDGSDLGRISSQQVFLSSLVRTLKSDDVLSDYGKLYEIAKAATANMQLSTNLANPQTIVAMAMAMVLKNLSLDRVMFVTYPGSFGTEGVYAGKVAPNTAVADELFAMIRADRPFAVEEGRTGLGSVADPNAPAPEPETPDVSASPGPGGGAADVPIVTGLLGQSAADHTCTKANR